MGGWIARGCPFFTRRPDLVQTCLIEAESGGIPLQSCTKRATKGRRVPKLRHHISFTFCPLSWKDILRSQISPCKLRVQHILSVRGQVATHFVLVFPKEDRRKFPSRLSHEIGHPRSNGSFSRLGVLSPVPVFDRLRPNAVLV